MRDDGAKSYALARAAQREIWIRKHQILPAVGNATEARWATEGPVDNRDLETVRRPP